MGGISRKPLYKEQAANSQHPYWGKHLLEFKCCNQYKNFGIGCLGDIFPIFICFVILAVPCQVNLTDRLSQIPSYLKSVTNCQKFYLVIILKKIFDLGGLFWQKNVRWSVFSPKITSFFLFSGGFGLKTNCSPAKHL